MISDDGFVSLRLRRGNSKIDTTAKKQILLLTDFCKIVKCIHTHSKKNILLNEFVCICGRLSAFLLEQKQKRRELFPWRPSHSSCGLQARDVTILKIEPRGRFHCAQLCGEVVVFSSFFFFVPKRSLLLDATDSLFSQCKT